ncbi:hypothetical protein PT974_01337 [Cladobotryum mycophilum]|uniref:BZIP domain-containing protein n=1 Tax=Cladobotryum mycophilum TaxID=491253 RepID=A0ABR0T3D7_9HYPO
MTKLLPSSDSFLPSGALDCEMPATYYANGNSSSILSPPSSKPPFAAPETTNERFSSPAPHLPIDSSSLALNKSHTSYAGLAPYTASSRAPLSSLSLSTSAPDPLPAFTFPPQPFSTDSFLPHSAGLSSDASTFRSPASPNHLALSGTTLGHLIPGLDTSASLSRSISADGAVPQQQHHHHHQQPSSHLIQRLTHQNALIREAWEAERNYLEANRRRAEEVYQEERAIMEDVRESWHHEKSDLLHEVQLLRERIQRLEGENSALKAIASQSIQVTGVLSPLASQRGDSVDGSAENSPSYFPIAADAVASTSEQILLQMHTGMSSAEAAATLPPGLDGASRRPHFASPPKQQLSSPPYILDPRTQPETSVLHDFLADSSEETETPVAVIDVQEIDPKLEGISLKATAIQKPTFTEEIATSPPITSPPAKLIGRHNRHIGSVLLKRGSSKEHTIQVLAAEESRRLTMHAGHTPNHSLSLFPTMTTATGASSALARNEEDDDVAENDDVNHAHDEVPPPGDDVRDAEEPLLEPTDDLPPLKGPLMIKNIPAQDDLFLAALNKKLEPISQGQDALPTVVQTPVAELDETHWPDTAISLSGGDAAQDSQSVIIRDDDDDDDDNNLGNRSMERDVPLKLRTTTNFGAPFGMM